MMLALLDDEFQEKAKRKSKPKLVTNLQVGIAFVTQICSNPFVVYPCISRRKRRAKVCSAGPQKKATKEIDLHEGSIHSTEGEEGGRVQKPSFGMAKKALQLRSWMNSKIFVFFSFLKLTFSGCQMSPQYFELLCRGICQQSRMDLGNNMIATKSQLICKHLRLGFNCCKLVNIVLR